MVHLYFPTYGYQEDRILAYAKGTIEINTGSLHLALAGFSSILVVSGSVGSILTSYVMCRSNAFVITFRMYLILISMTDILLLLKLCGNSVILTFTNYNPIFSLLLSSDIACRTYHVFVGFLEHFAIWTHILLMVELYVMNARPKRMNARDALDRGHILALLVLAITLVINMNYFWTIQRQKEPLGIEEHDLCYFDSSFELFETKIYPVFDLILTGIAPLMATGYLIVYTFTRYKSLSNTQQGGLLISVKEYHDIAYAMAIPFLLTNIPRWAWKMYKFVHYSTYSELNPGISTLQRFHTELLEGDIRMDFALALFMATRALVLSAASKQFRKVLFACQRDCCCCATRPGALQALKPPQKQGAVSSPSGTSQSLLMSS